MAQEKPSQFPDPIHSLADNDYLLLSQRDTSTNLWVSVRCSAAMFKDYLSQIPQPIGCAGATVNIGINVSMIWNGVSEELLPTLPKSFKVYNNETNELLAENELPPLSTGAGTDFYEQLASDLTGLGDLVVIATDRPGGGASNALMTFENISSSYQRLRLEIYVGNEGSIEQNLESSNPTYTESVGGIEFCLAPAV